MMNQLKKELIKIAACATIGLGFGICFAIGRNTWWFGLLGPFYVIGSLYGIMYFGKMLAKSAGFAAKNIMEAIVGMFSKHFLVGLIRILFAVAAVMLVLAVGWIPGIFVAGKALLESRSQIPDAPQILHGTGSAEWTPTEKPMTSSSKTPALPPSHNSSNNDDDW